MIFQFQGRGYQAPPQRPSSGGVPGYHASPGTTRQQQPRPHQPRPQAGYPAQPRPQYVPVPTAAAPRPTAAAGPYRPPAPQPPTAGYIPRPTAPGVFDTSTLLNTLQHSTGPQAAAPQVALPPPQPPRPRPPVQASVAPPAAPVYAPAPVAAAASIEDEGEKKLSKAAKAKLRKKLREGKA